MSHEEYQRCIELDRGYADLGGLARERGHADRALPGRRANSARKNAARALEFVDTVSPASTNARPP